MAEPSTSTPKTSYDFAFILQQTHLLKSAVAALVDPRFNERGVAVIQVGKGGVEITVQVTDSKTQNQVFGFLRLMSTALGEFECDRPLRKTVCLKSFHGVLEGAVKNDDDSVEVFVDSGSNKLSFRLCREGIDDGHAQPVSVDLQDVEPEQETFPNVYYGFEAVITSEALMDTITQLLEMDPEIRPTEAVVTLKAATVVLELDDEHIIDTGNEPGKHEVQMDWQYWESLQKASCSADKCSMYLVTDPPEHIMFRFKLQELGDLVYLTQAKFLDVSDLPDLDNFRSLLNMRGYHV